MTEEEKSRVIYSHKIRGSGEENAPDPWFSHHLRHAHSNIAWAVAKAMAVTDDSCFGLINISPLHHQQKFVKHAFVSAKEGLDIVTISILAVRI